MNWHLTHVEETESTNLLARSGRPGDVFTADFQTAGRGRLDHRWLAARGQNLMMSAVIDVSDLIAEHAATLPLAVGFAVVEALRPMAPRLMLKWPNDVLFDGRKLSGILCERHGDNAIAGIGVNVRQCEFPSEIVDRATSLALLGSNTSVAEVRDAVLDSLSRVIAAWRSGFASIYPRLKAIDYLAGRYVAIRQLDDALPSASGICGGIQPDGSLLVGNSPVWAGEAHVAEVKAFAAQEKHHGEVTKAILEKYAPEFLVQKSGGKKFVCPVCGFEYEGDINAEPVDWKCPICGVPKSVFKEG